MVSDRIETYFAGELRRNDRDRWLTASLAPRPVRDALYALYAFHLEIARTRDLVSEQMMGEIRLQWWRETVEEAARGSPRAHPVAEALAPHLAAGRIAADDLIALVDAREADLTGEGFATEDDFIGYLDATAGALNRVALRALGAGDGTALSAGDRVGRAYGIAGQIRAAAFNARRGRVLLPRDVLARHHVTMAALQNGRPEPGLRGAASELSDRARVELAAARGLRSSVPRHALPVLALAGFAGGYLKRIGAAGYDVFSDRLEPPPIAGPLYLLRTMATGRY